MKKLSEALRISLSNLMPLSNNEKIEILHYIGKQDEEIERLNNIINELDNIFYESFRISQNGIYTITETDYKEIEHKLKELKGVDKE